MMLCPYMSQQSQRKEKLAQILNIARLVVFLYWLREAAKKVFF